MEHEIALVVERGLVAANVGEGFAAQYLVDEFGEGGGVHRIRLVARQAADDGMVCAVAFAGEGERAVHMGAEAGNFIQQPLFDKLFAEQHTGTHRPHGMRTGRADADFEHIENADHFFHPFHS